jgi:rubrerythrin
MAKAPPKTPDEILQLALSKEQSAHDFYDSMATQCHVEFVRELLERLRDEEGRHVRMVQDMITRLELGRPLV